MTKEMTAFSGVLACSLFAVLSLAAPCALGDIKYTVTDLGVPPGSIYSEATGINNAGVVVGLYTYSTGPGFFDYADTAFIYSGGVMQGLGAPPFPFFKCTGATGINNAGQVVGNAYMPIPNLGSRAFLFSGGNMVDLGCIPGGVGDLVQANGVNNAGQVVGFSDFGGGLDVHAFLYSGGQMQDLGNLGGTGLNDNSYAYGINNLGQAVGQGTTANGATHAFLYSGGKMQDLGAFGGASSIAYGINDSGEIIGQCNAPSGGFAFLYSGGEVKELPFEPLAINNAGQVVGYGGTGNGASLYSGGTTLDLNTLIDPSSGWKLVKATAINDVGQIVGDGINPGGQQEAFLLSLLGDFNHDGVVNAADLDQLYVNFTAKVGTYNSLYDANGDGVVNQADVDYILQNVLHCAYGDADLNGAVDFVDFQTLLSHWEKTGAGWAGGDCNGDGVVDFVDFQNLLNYWSPGGSNFAFSEAPEPASLTLVLLGGLALLRRSRKA